MKPHPYHPTVSPGWWLARPSYFRYMLRELSCVFVGAYTAVLIAGLGALAEGEARWAAFLDGLGSAPGILFQLIALAFVLYHTFTWFALAPRSMPARLGGRPVPAAAITGAHYLVWAAFTLAILWLGGP